MAPTQEVEFEFNITPPDSVVALNPVAVSPTWSRTSTADSETDSDGIEAYLNVQIPALPNLQNILRCTVGSDNLEAVEEVKLKVIAHEVGLQHLSFHTPALRELTLDGSVVCSLRDLGCGLKALKVLRVNRCGLTSLDGINGMRNLEKLYAANNHIRDLTNCTSLEFIKHIDVTKNNLRDVNMLTFLTLCEKLEHLVLEGNPRISDSANYRETVKSLLPKLRSLDGTEYLEEVVAANNAEQENATNSDSNGNGKEFMLPPIRGRKSGGSAAAAAAAGSSGNCSYSVSFSPRVLSPRTESNDASGRSGDIKVSKTELPKI